MNRQELEHIIRAAADITKHTELIIIGSQAILGQFPNAPEPLLISMEADVYAPAAPELSDKIDGALGPDTMFDKTYGYHADGVSPNTASLPAGWRNRLFPIRNPNTNGATGWCIEVHDIAIAKYAAGREKDLRYTGDLWRHDMLNPATLAGRLRNTQLKPTDKPREWIERTIARQRREREAHRRSHAPVQMSEPHRAAEAAAAKAGGPRERAHREAQARSRPSGRGRA